MNLRFSRRWLVALGVTASVLVLTGAAVGVAIAQQGPQPGATTTPTAPNSSTTGPTTPSNDDVAKAFWDRFAQALGTTPDKAQDAAKSAAKATVADLVKQGKLTQQQADRLNQLIDQGISNTLFPLGKLGGEGPHRGGQPEGALLDAASSYLGISKDDIRNQQRGGKSLADIANATPGKNEQGLIDALVKAETDRIDQLVKDGKLTNQQADSLKQGLKDRITRQVEAKPGQGGIPFGPGFVGPFGFPSLDAASNYLGIPTDNLRQQLSSGKSLADIANATPGKNEQGLIDALTKAANDAIDKAVTDKKLTDSMATQLKQRVPDMVKAFVEQKGGRFEFRFGPGRPNSDSAPTTGTINGGRMGRGGSRA